ncbi:Malate/L-lactate dehydrogenase [Pollutimonas bauzanensis]|uniref:Malate/L-lactate dehydrogenase n=2 Tax=Pollutimonas bauzanensis TaxID=658167 RepID=A0A1M5YG36_9BURK|nr:Ldh family oxidoreductase [Pollutimonas bauzanensis]SHI10854.1 Malate/L-lactate dehydrogenase [Pollutimonas bauzanensis]
MTTHRYSAAELNRCATEILSAAGMEAALAAVVAETLVEGDLLGHDTHGLALLAPYIKEIENGAMALSGSAQSLSDRGAALLWDGRRLPGPWLVRQGLDALAPRARQYGSATLVIRRSHHIACLAAYLLRATEQGLMLVLASSDPAVASVAPHGGTRATFTPDPIAAGIPTSGTPFLVDISSSIVTNGMSSRLHKEGGQFGHECMLDADGRPSRDPAVLATDPPGTIMPLGGLQSGHKGFGLALIVEALTGGLAGHGRADPPLGWGATVFMTLYDPAAFAGADEFMRQTDWIADACRNNPPRPGSSAVRMPGDRGIASKQEQMRLGIALHPTIPPMLEECAQRYGVAFPRAIDG